MSISDDAGGHDAISNPRIRNRGITDHAGGEDHIELVAHPISAVLNAKGTLDVELQPVTATAAGTAGKLVSEADLTFKVRIYEKDDETGHRLVTFSDADEVLLAFDLMASRIEIGMHVRRLLDNFDW